MTNQEFQELLIINKQLGGKYDNIVEQLAIDLNFDAEGPGEGRANLGGQAEKFSKEIGEKILAVVEVTPHDTINESSLAGIIATLLNTNPHLANKRGWVAIVSKFDNGSFYKSPCRGLVEYSSYSVEAPNLTKSEDWNWCESYVTDGYKDPKVNPYSCKFGKLDIFATKITISDNQRGVLKTIEIPIDQIESFTTLKHNFSFYDATRGDEVWKYAAYRLPNEDLYPDTIYTITLTDNKGNERKQVLSDVKMYQQIDIVLEKDMAQDIYPFTIDFPSPQAIIVYSPEGKLLNFDAQIGVKEDIVIHPTMGLPIGEYKIRVQDREDAKFKDVLLKKTTVLGAIVLNLETSKDVVLKINWADMTEDFAVGVAGQCNIVARNIISKYIGVLVNEKKASKDGLTIKDGLWATNTFVSWLISFGKDTISEVVPALKTVKLLCGYIGNGLTISGMIDKTQSDITTKDFREAILSEITSYENTIKLDLAAGNSKIFNEIFEKLQSEYSEKGYTENDVKREIDNFVGTKVLKHLDRVEIKI